MQIHSENKSVETNSFKVLVYHLAMCWEFLDILDNKLKANLRTRGLQGLGGPPPFTEEALRVRGMCSLDSTTGQEVTVQRQAPRPLHEEQNAIC